MLLSISALLHIRETPTTACCFSVVLLLRRWCCKVHTLSGLGLVHQQQNLEIVPSFRDFRAFIRVVGDRLHVMLLSISALLHIRETPTTACCFPVVLLLRR
jgi:hypothetical protein